MEKSQVRKLFFKTVKEMHKIDPALKDSLLRCESPLTQTTQSQNINRFIDNLAREIKDLQIHTIKSGKPPFDVSEIKWIISEMVKVLCHGLELKAKRMYESDLAKTLRERKAQEVKDMDETDVGRPSGVYEEMGVQVVNDRDSGKRN